MTTTDPIRFMRPLSPRVVKNKTHFAYYSSIFWTVFVLIFSPLTGFAQDGGADVVRGRVLDEEGNPVKGASVTVIGLQSKIERTVKTNDKGVYTVLFTTAEGEYVVIMRMLGRSPQRKRVLRDEQMGNLLVTDFTISKSTELAAVDVSAKRASADKDRANKGVGDRDDEIDLEQGKLFSLDPSDLSTLMQGMPGVVYIPGKNGEPGTYSVLGADPSENTTLVDGMASDMQRLPADAIQSATLNTASFDPSRGRFSGGMMSVTTRSGTNIWSASFGSVLSDPRMAWKDPNWVSPIPKQHDWSASMSGPLIKNKVFYNTAYQINRSTTGLQSLLTLKDRFYRQYGLIPDTVRAVNEALTNLGIPLTTSAIPNQTITTNQSASFKTDFNPTATTAASIFASGSWSQNDGNGISATTYPVFGTGSSRSSGSFQFNATTYFGSILNEFQIGSNRSVNKNAPYVLLPGGRVLIPSSYEDGRTGLATLNFGGNTSAGRMSSNSTSLQIRNLTSWLTTDSRHQFKLGGEFRVDRNSTSAVGDQFGTFAYQSLNDLLANRPTSYNRTLSSQARKTSAVSFAVSLSDSWRATDAWSFQYGVRFDVARSGTRPGYNPVVDSIFGRRTDRVPQDFGLSPRFGFSWVQGGEEGRRQRNATMFSTGNQPGRMMARPWSPIRISGGIGAFRNAVDPGTIASLIDATGLPNTVRQLTCVGDATPIPNWTEYLNNPDIVPSTCLDGTAPVEFSTDKPTVRLYNPNFSPTLAWNAQLSVNGFEKKGWAFGFTSDLRLGFNNQSQIDLNLNRTPAFYLENEGRRPVYVEPGAIVSTTGAVAPGASRITDRFGAVMDNVSDLRSFTTSFGVRFNKLSPLFGRIPINGSYTYSVNKQQFRGQSTTGDPFAREWAGGRMPTHTITLNSYFTVKWISINANLNLNSGQLYTPSVVGDLNGDGSNNDRAFIFDPAQVSDPVFADELRTLLSSTSSQARKCLRQNLGRMAGLNSCKTGWILQPNINLSIIDPSKNLSFQNRLTFSIVTQNMMSVFARAFGMSNTLLSRNYSMPDATLFYVDGFDPTTRQFKYRVNQQFGTTQETRFRRRSNYPPFQIGLRARLELGGTPYRSFAQGLGLVPTGKEPPLSREQIRERLLQRLMSNPIDQILAAKDTLLLTEEQVKKMTARSQQFVAQADSLMDPVEDYVLEKGKKAKDAELMKRIGKIQPKVIEAMMETVKDVAEILSEEQVGKLPPLLQRYIQLATQNQKGKG
jgi:hypothetical protein